jgi:hypothetical protein
VKVGENLRWLSRLWWFTGHKAEAEEAAESALAALDGLPEGVQHAWVYSNKSQLCMVADDRAGACEWGERAIALAERLGEVDVLVHALNNVGSARAAHREAEGLAQLERSLDLALCQ